MLLVVSPPESPGHNAEHYIQKDRLGRRDVDDYEGDPLGEKICSQGEKPWRTVEMMAMTIQGWTRGLHVGTRRDISQYMLSVSC